MFEAGKTYKTREGRDARIYATDGGGKYPMHGAVFNDDEWDTCSWTLNGRCWHHGENGDDLLPPKISGWVNVYPEALYTSRDAAVIKRRHNAVATIHIEFEEGEGL